MRVNKKYFIVLLVLLTSILVGLFVFDRPSKNEYAYLARRIQIDNPNNIRLNFTTLRKDLTRYLDNLEDKSNKVSIYYEYLPSGVSININENNEVVGASLMKLPVIMNMYKLVEKGEISMDTKVKLKKEWLNSDYGNLYTKGEGYELTLREAAEYTLKDSDNTALLAIWDTAKMQNMETSDQALYYMDIEFEVLKDQTVLIGARSYSSILKCLYFSCYNSFEHSNEILEYLSRSTFNDRLTKYTPKDLKVSHKIGTYSQNYQSDCGVFYVPKENYILCVMVEGDEIESGGIMADISRIVYKFAESKNTK